MNTIVLYTLIVLCATGVIAAVILYVVARVFKVEEDSRIDTVESLLPGANCGGCGKAGCRNFAESCVKSDSLSGLLCPVGGIVVMEKIAEALGQKVEAAAPRLAVVRCGGTCELRPKTSVFDGLHTCAFEHSVYRGESGCAYGCLGYGDCMNSCQFGAIRVGALGVPEVDPDKCVACGACVKACPRHLIELRLRGPKERRVYVSCSNHDKGGVARKYCKNACLGCGICAKNCPFDAIVIENNMAYIDDSKCNLCAKCVTACPQKCIIAVNFPRIEPKEKSDVTPNSGLK